MFKRSLLSSLLFCFVLTCTAAKAQNLCPPGVKSDKLICLIPQVYGVDGLQVQATSPGITPHFQNVLPDSLRSLNSAIARQAVLLPLASPSSGITFTFDPEHHVYLSSTDSFGPIFSERADTIGKYKAFVGASYQYFTFGNIDGVSLKNLPAVFLQQDDQVTISGMPRTCSVNNDDMSGCGYIRDVIKTDNRIDLKTHQFTTFMTFGLTDRVDISVAIPIVNLRMSISSHATIVNNSNSTGQTFAHTFKFRKQDGCGDLTTTPPTPCADQLFSDSRSVSGIGDIILRVKGTAWKSARKDGQAQSIADKGERAALAFGVDIRVPSGDALNFLGAGAAGVRPFVVWSYRSRVSPHISVGYETNGSSKIAGDISMGIKERLPGQLTYSSGADVWLTKRVTAALDLVGQQVFQARRTVTTNFVEPEACKDPSGLCDPGFDFATPNVDLAVAQTTGTYNVSYASLGAKIRPFSNLLITGNVLVKLNDGGLGTKAIPLIGASYTF